MILSSLNLYVKVIGFFEFKIVPKKNVTAHRNQQ